MYIASLLVCTKIIILLFATIAVRNPSSPTEYHRFQNDIHVGTHVVPFIIKFSPNFAHIFFFLISYYYGHYWSSASKDLFSLKVSNLSLPTCVLVDVIAGAAAAYGKQKLKGCYTLYQVTTKGKMLCNL